IGDRVTLAIEYRAKDVRAGTGIIAVSGGIVAPNAVIEGTVSEVGEIVVVDCGAAVLVRGDTLGKVQVGDAIEFTVDGEGAAYVIPTRG
ncbi:MAG: hypothetical protein M3R54_00555, partial [Chloroflexota bacterium]|nr:hypothetical protein [Chloroflexota bacterium]